MIALIDQYRKKLLKVNGFAPSTVDTYTISVRARPFVILLNMNLELTRSK